MGQVKLSPDIQGNKVCMLLKRLLFHAMYRCKIRRMQQAHLDCSSVPSVSMTGSQDCVHRRFWWLKVAVKGERLVGINASRVGNDAEWLPYFPGAVDSCITCVGDPKSMGAFTPDRCETHIYKLGHLQSATCNGSAYKNASWIKMKLQTRTAEALIRFDCIVSSKSHKLLLFWL